MDNALIKKNIEEYGWHFVFVFDPKDEKQAFAYTIGLEETHQHPEIVIFGLEENAAHTILSDIRAEIEAGITFEPDKRLGNVIGGDLEVLFRSVSRSAYSEYLGTAVNYYNKPFRAQIMFWPDRQNVLPLEEGCEVTIQDEALQII